MSRRLEPTVFLAMISPMTVGIVVGAAALGRILTSSWIVAVVFGVVAWIGRVGIALAIARRVRGLAARIDPFALREPWRFFVRDALSARSRFNNALEDADDGPLRDRLHEIGAQLEHAVEVTWEVAQRGQQITDARRAIDISALEKTLAAAEESDQRRASTQSQIDSHGRLAEREDQARSRLDLLAAQLDETVVRARELATRTGGAIELDSLASQVDEMVIELDSLRVALDEVSGPQ